MIKINYIFLELFLVVVISLTASYFFFYLDNNFIYNNNYFPWDSFEYLKALKNYEYNSAVYKVLSPFNERILFPLIVYKTSLILDIEYLNSCLLINLFSTVICFVFFFFISIKFRISIITRWLIFIIFLFSWEGPLRTALYYPGSTFGFDCMLISLITIYGYLYLESKNKYYKILLFIFFFFFTLQRGLVIVIIPLIYLILKLAVNKYIKLKNQYDFFRDTFFYCFTISLIAYFSIKYFSNNEGSYSFFKTLIKFSYFRLHPLEFLYTYYFALGPVFLLFLSYLFSLKKNKINFFFKKIINKDVYQFFFSIFLSSLLIVNLGGDDSNRFLLWYLVLYLLFGCICLDYFLKINKKYTFVFILVTGLLWSRFFIPSQPPLAFAEKFIFNQFVGTNYDEKFYYGINFLKKFKNKLYEDRVVLGDPYNLEKSIKYQNIFVTQNFLDPKYYYFKYLSAYKYKINNIPFPIGYLHNQRDALIDHPTFGAFWVRLLYILQWFVLTILFIFRLNKFSK